MRGRHVHMLCMGGWRRLRASAAGCWLGTGDGHAAGRRAPQQNATVEWTHAAPRCSTIQLSAALRARPAVPTILSMPRGPSEVRMASATALAASMFISRTSFFLALSLPGRGGVGVCGSQIAGRRACSGPGAQAVAAAAAAATGASWRPARIAIPSLHADLGVPSRAAEAAAAPLRGHSLVQLAARSAGRRWPCHRGRHDPRLDALPAALPPSPGKVKDVMGRCRGRRGVLTLLRAA